MDVEYFKREFMNFLLHFEALTNNRNIRPIVAPLTYEQILGAVTEVINSKLNVVLVDSSQDVRTPAAGIIVTTPDAPDIPKVNIEHGENGGIAARFRSLDTLIADNLNDTPTEPMSPPQPSSFPAHNEIDDNVDSAETNTLKAEKKDTSGSNQSVSTLVRSDTYVRENELNDASNDDGFDAKNVLPEFPTTANGNDNFSMLDLNVPEFRKRLNTLRDVATEVVRKIDDLEKVVPDNTRPIRRLSTIGCFPGMNRAAATTRTIQRPKMSRRSLTSFPGTPTSSRLSPGAGKGDNLSNVKSTLTASLVNISTSRLSIPSTFRSVSSGALTIGKKTSPSPSRGLHLTTMKAPKGTPSTLRSVSSGALKLEKRCSKSPTQGSRPLSAKGSKTSTARSPALSLMNLAGEAHGRPSKNPKYAHVQSTLSKVGPVLGKRKADEF